MLYENRRRITVILLTVLLVTMLMLSSCDLSEAIKLKMLPEAERVLYLYSETEAYRGRVDALKTESTMTMLFQSGEAVTSGMLKETEIVFSRADENMMYLSEVQIGSTDTGKWVPSEQYAEGYSDGKMFYMCGEGEEQDVRFSSEMTAEEFRVYLALRERAEISPDPHLALRDLTVKRSEDGQYFTLCYHGAYTDYDVKELSELFPFPSGMTEKMEALTECYVTVEYVISKKTYAPISSVIEYVWTEPVVEEARKADESDVAESEWDTTAESDGKTETVVDSEEETGIEVFPAPEERRVELHITRAYSAPTEEDESLFPDLADFKEVGSLRYRAEALEALQGIVEMESGSFCVRTSAELGGACEFSYSDETRVKFGFDEEDAYSYRLVSAYTGACGEKIISGGNQMIYEDGLLHIYTGEDFTEEKCEEEDAIRLIHTYLRVFRFPMNHVNDIAADIEENGRVAVTFTVPSRTDLLADLLLAADLEEACVTSADMTVTVVIDPSGKVESCRIVVDAELEYAVMGTFTAHLEKVYDGFGSTQVTVASLEEKTEEMP